MKRIQERDALIVSHLGLVQTIARLVYRTAPGNVTFDDLVGAGYEGLVEAATRFDATRSILFASFAQHRVRGAMLDQIQQFGIMTHGQIKELNRIRRYQSRFADDRGREPTEQEVVDAVGISLERLHYLQQAVGLHHVSLEIAVGLSCPNSVAVDDAVILSTEIRDALGCLSLLSRTERFVIMEVFLKSRKQKDVAVDLGVTESRVAQVKRAGLRRLHLWMQVEASRSCDASTGNKLRSSRL